MKGKNIFVSILLIICLSPVFGQPAEIKLWPSGIPGAISNNTYTEISSIENGVITRWSKVTEPTLTAFLPSREKASGSAVLICPGGGYSMLAFGHEGIDIAKWLNENGIAGFVLKYRLPSDLIMKNKSTGPLQDAQEAMRTIRRRAKEWNIDPKKIGVIGFSAGGHLASTLSTHYDENIYDVKDGVSARPDFSLLIYPVITMDETFTHAGSRRNLIGENPSDELIRRFSNELMINDNTPPAFLVHSADDKVVPVKNSQVYFGGLLKYNIPSELHIFQKGGHGYGLSSGQGTQAAWPGLCLEWLKASGVY